MQQNRFLGRLFSPRNPVVYNRPILVAVTSEHDVKRVICKTWTGTLTNSADPDQTPQNAASDHDLHSLLILREVKG